MIRSSEQPAVRSEWSLYVGLLGKVQTKLSLALPNRGKENMWGRQGELGLLLPLPSGEREDGAGLLGMPLTEAVLLFPCGGRPFLLGPPWHFRSLTGGWRGLWLDQVCYLSSVRIVWCISSKLADPEDAVKKCWRFFSSADFQLQWNAQIKCKNISA